ncbi:MAG: hypothetical protein KGO49_14225 [Gammaproteobacteria bacterium]|nr:hypothetical protein [Gammaproteobacteria bacterium]
MRIAYLATAFLLSSSLSAVAAAPTESTSTNSTSAASASQTSASQPALLPKDHPLLGVWKWVTPNSDCSETYEFKSNSRMVFSSGAEEGISEIEVTLKPSVNNFYRFTNKVIADNGKKDCRGEPGKAGVTSVIYVYFLPTNNQMKMCYKETSDSCFGPLTRQ